MGMRGSILGITPAQIDGLVATPALVTDLVLVSWDETRKAHMASEQRQQFEASRAADDRAPAAKKLWPSQKLASELPNWARLNRPSTLESRGISSTFFSPEK
jgi:hypothetical protein